MRQFILTFLIISNISAGLEVSADFDDAWEEINVFTVVSGLESSLMAVGSETEEDAVCDHCCHAAAHFSGAIVSCLTTPYVRSSTDGIFSDTSYHFSGRSPPTPPPNV